MDKGLIIQRTPFPFTSLQQLPEYLSLIHPTTIPYLSNPSSLTRWVVIEARLNGELVGLSLSELYPLNRIAQFESLVIKPHYRRQGIGRQLFAFTEDLLIQEEEIETIEIMYEQTDPFTPALEKIMISLGWYPGRLLLLRCYFNLDTFNPPWLYRSFPLPISTHFFLWKDLQSSEREYISYLIGQSRVLPYLSPFREEELIDLETSVGLRQNDQLIGWNITRRPNPSTLRYSSLYIDNHLLPKRYGILLLAESIHIQKHLQIPYALFEVNLTQIDSTWWLFIKKRLLPWANKIEYIKKGIRTFTTFLDS